jgi:sugar lactone lactonase YvrE
MKWFVTCVIAMTAAGTGMAADAPAAAPDPALVTRLERLRALRMERPGDGLLAFYQALTHAALGQRDAAVAELRSLRGRGLGLVPGRGFEALQGSPDFRAVRAQLAAETPATPEAPVLLELRDAGLVPEGIAYDAARGRYFVGSIAKRKIVAVDRRGRARDFSRSADRLEAVLGMAVDEPRGALWAVSTNGFLDEARSARRNAVVRYDLSSGRLVARHDVPEAVQLNDVAIAADGTLYATDSAGGSVFRLAPGGGRLEPVGATGRLPGANGIAVAPNGAVYVAVSTGIARLEPATGTAARLPQPDDVVTGGVDGLYWHRDGLLGVQNGLSPGRVVRIALSDGGKRVSGVSVLQSHHHPLFDEPTTGTIARDRLIVIANSHVARHRADGTIDDPAALRPPALIAVPLR